MKRSDKGVIFTPTAAVAKGKKRIFRFQLADVHVGLGSSTLGALFYRGGVTDAPTGGEEMGSYFADELGELGLSNPTADFRTFKDTVKEMVLTKPLLVHHRDEVANALLDCIRYDALALSSFSKLSYHLCKDLGLLFVPYIDRFVAALVASLMSPRKTLKQDVGAIKTAFLVCTGYLRVLSPQLTTAQDNNENPDGAAHVDAESLLSILRPIIAVLPHKHPAIARLAGECLSVCVRKLTHAPTLQAVMRECVAVVVPAVEREQETGFASDEKAAEKVISGVASMLFECIKGVNARWHSRFEFFLETTLDELVARPSPILHATLKKMVKLSGFHADQASYLALLEPFCERLRRCLDSASAAAAAPTVTAYLLSFVTGLSERPRLITPDFTKHVRVFVEEHGTALVQACVAAEAEDALASLVEFVLAYARHPGLSGPFTLLMSDILKSGQASVDVLCDFVVGLSDVPAFSAGIRPAAVAAVNVHCQRVAQLAPAKQQKEVPRMLTLLAALYETSESGSLHDVAASLVLTAVLSAELDGDVKWLAWKLSYYLPDEQRARLTLAAKAIVEKEDTHAIVGSYALRLLLSVGSPDLLDAAVLLAERGCASSSSAYFASPSIAAALAAVFADEDFLGRLTAAVPAAAAPAKKQKKAASPAAAAATRASDAVRRMRDIGLAMVRSGHPAVRLSGIQVLSNIYESLSALLGCDEGEAAAAKLILDAAQRGETLRADLLEQNREKVQSYEGVVKVVKDTIASGKSREKASGVLTIACSVLLGALNIRFRPLWAKAKDGLRMIAEADVDGFWALFKRQLEVFEKIVEADRTKQAVRTRDARKRAEAANDDAASEDGAAEEASEGDASGDEGVDEDDDEEDSPHATVTDLWDEAVAAEESSSGATTLQSQFKSLWDLVDLLPTHTLAQQLRATGRSVFEEVYRCYVGFTEGGAAAAKEEEEAEVSAYSKAILKPDQVMAAFLRILVKQETPEKTLSESACKAYRERLWALLSHATEDIQRLAIDGLKWFHDMQKFKKYEEKLKSLVPAKGFKNALLNLNFDEVKAENVQLAVFNLLRPKLWQNLGGARQQVLQFVTGITEVQLHRFMSHIIFPIFNANRTFHRSKKRESRYLEFVWAVVDTMGARLERFVETINSNVLEHLRQSYIVKEGHKLGSAHREARRVTLRVLTKMFRQFPDMEWSETFVSELAEIMKNPVADLQGSAATMGALMNFLTCLSEDERLIPILDRFNALAPLTALLGHGAIAIEVYAAVLRLLSSVIATDSSLFVPVAASYVAGLHSASQGKFKGDVKAFSHTVQSLESSSPILIDTCTGKDGVQGEAEGRTLAQLMHFLIETLLNRKLRPSEAATETCTGVLVKVLPAINPPEGRGQVDFYVSLLTKMAPLFYNLRHSNARETLGLACAKVLERAAASDEADASTALLLELSKLVTQTNAMTAVKVSSRSRRRRDDDAEGVDDDVDAAAAKPKEAPEVEMRYDFDTRISAFYAISEFFNTLGLKRKQAKKESDKAKGPAATAREATAAAAAAATQEALGDDAEEAGGGAMELDTEDLKGLAAFRSIPLETLKVTLLLPLAYNLSYYVGDLHQSIRTTSALALKSLIKALRRVDKRQEKAGVKKAEDKGAYQGIILPVVHHGARIGVRLPELMVRQEWIRVYGSACLHFDILPGLANANSDFDFFELVTHQQSSRQMRALTLFKQHSKAVPESILENIFIPYLLRLLQTWGVDKRKEVEEMTLSESSKLQALTGSLLKLFSHLASHLSWGRYNRLVMTLLKQESTSNAMEKAVCQCIQEVLDSFHFLPEAVITPEGGQEVDEEEGADADADAAEQDQGKEDQARRIGDVLVEKIIPAVHRFWKSGNKTEDGEEKVSLNRIVVSVSILRLMRFVPKDVDFMPVVDNILTDMVAKLKTKRQPQRDKVREVLGDALVVLGPQFLANLVTLLRATLAHGYQTHVLGYTVVMLINKASAAFGKGSERADAAAVNKSVDACLSDILDVLFDDNIGIGGTEKEVEELAKTMKEVKKNRSLEGFELVSTIATPDLLLEMLVGRVQVMFTPMERVKKTYRPEEQRFKTGGYKGTEEKEAQVDTIDTSNNLELLSRVKIILRRCARGVTRNDSFVPAEMVDYSSSALRENAAAREAFLETFEVKQSSMKVRLLGTSGQEDIEKARAANTARGHLVLPMPERRDMGFEKREVNSQKRQLGSVRKKGQKQNESRKRIVVPGLRARQTLQSMDCVDELAISLAWNIVNRDNKEEKQEVRAVVPLVASLVGPIVEVIGGEASDSVVTLAMLVLQEVLKCVDAKVDEELVAEVMGLAFEVVERSGEIRSACFRLIAVLLLHRQADFTEGQAAVCCALIRTELDKKVTHVIPALHLVKAIVVRRVEVADIYDLIPIVQEKMLHHSKSAIVSAVAASIVARFLTDWKMTEKKLHSHIDFVVKNLQYPIAEGRVALLELFQVCDALIAPPPPLLPTPPTQPPSRSQQIILKRFPDALLKKEIEYFFVPLAHRLMADESKAVRKKSSAVMAVLFSLAGKGAEGIVTILEKWVDTDTQPALQITALQVMPPTSPPPPPSLLRAALRPHTFATTGGERSSEGAEGVRTFCVALR